MMDKNLNKKEEIICSLEQVMSQVCDLNGTTLINLTNGVANIYRQLVKITEDVDDNLMVRE